jgi:hypothetical protein
MQLESRAQAFLPGVTCGQPGLRWGTEPGFGVGTLPVGTGGGLGVTATLPATRVTGGSNGAARRGTPIVLRTIAGFIVLLALLFGVTGTLATVARQSATSASWQTAEPLMVTAQTIDTSLSDADTTAAASFLQGRVEPAALQQRYNTDLTTASAGVARAAQEAGSDPAVADAITTLSTDLPAYSGVIQEADFNERGANYPLAAAYLAEANNLMRTSILPAAAQLYGIEGQRLADDQSNAASTLLTVLAAVALVALLAALVLAQRWLSARFHRTWNVALASATVLVLVLSLWAAVALLAQHSGVASAEQNGSRPVSTFTDARILALRARADDELTLLTRDSDVSYQKDYASTAAALKGLLAGDHMADRGSDPLERQESARALDAWDAYSSVHQQVRRADSSGHLTDAVALASASGPHGLPTVSAGLDGALATGIVGSQEEFVTTTSRAASDLDGLVWGLALGALVVVVLVLVGFGSRLAEYR